MKFFSIAIIFFLALNVSCAANAQQNQQYILQDAFPNLSFNNPVDLQHANDGTNRLFVVSQHGLIYVFENISDASSAKTFSDTRDKVIAGGELFMEGVGGDLHLVWAGGAGDRAGQPHA